MDYKVVWDDEAIGELGQAVRCSAQYNSAAARKTGEAILQKAGSLGQFPEMGKIFRELNRQDVREIPVPLYRIVYQIKDVERCVRILKVWHGTSQEFKMKHFKAIAAMSLNRVIGAGNKIPWHLPEDFKWFKQLTSGNVVVMGRKTFESLGKPLPNRVNVVLSRHPGRLQRDFPEVFGSAWVGRGKTHIPDRPHQFELPKMGGAAAVDLRIIKDVMKLDPESSPLEFYIAGGAQIYEQTLPFCSDLYLTVVKREVEGDAFFPPFEDKFDLIETVRDEPEFKILHYRHRSLFSLEQ